MLVDQLHGCGDRDNGSVIVHLAHRSVNVDMLAIVRVSYFPGRVKFKLWWPGLSSTPDHQQQNSPDRAQILSCPDNMKIATEISDHDTPFTI